MFGGAIESKIELLKSKGYSVHLDHPSFDLIIQKGIYFVAYDFDEIESISDQVFMDHVFMRITYHENIGG